jgi:hypothetical protein
MKIYFFLKRQITFLKCIVVFFAFKTSEIGSYHNLSPNVLLCSPPNLYDRRSARIPKNLDLLRRQRPLYDHLPHYYRSILAYEPLLVI